MDKTKRGLRMALLLCWAAIGCNAQATERGLAMADTMLDMMQSMGLFRNRPEGQTMLDRWNPGNWSAPADGAMGKSRVQPWNRTSLLDGIWRGRGGERLQINAQRFRLLSGRGQQVGGILQIRGKLLSLYLPRLQRPWTYEFAEHQGRLVLRDQAGNLFLFRRQDPPYGRAPSGVR